MISFRIQQRVDIVESIYEMGVQVKKFSQKIIFSYAAYFEIG